MNQQLSELLAETIVKFCRKHNYFDQELQVQGTICITSDVTSFLVTQICDKFHSPPPSGGLMYEVYDSPRDLSVLPRDLSVLPGPPSYLEEAGETLEEAPPSPGLDSLDTTTLRYSRQSTSKPRPHKGQRNGKSSSSSLGQIKLVKRPQKWRKVDSYLQEAGVVKEERGSEDEEEEEGVHPEGRTHKRVRRSLTPETNDPERTQSSESLPSVKSEPVLVEDAADDVDNVSTSLETEYLTPQFASFGSPNFSLNTSRNAASSFVEKRPDGKYGCALCDVEYSNRGTLQRHIDGRHLGRNYTCVICHVTFESHSGWSRHLRSKHSQHMPLSCELCGKKFKFSMALEQHKRRLHSAEMSLDSNKIAH